MSRLRTYAPLARVSSRRTAERPEHAAVYRQVALRSGGRCEVNLLPTTADSFRCRTRATDPHHTVKPRASNTTPDKVVHLCRLHHDRVEWPYKRGRLVITPLGAERFTFELRFASDKWSARGTP